MPLLATFNTVSQRAWELIDTSGAPPGPPGYSAFANISTPNANASITSISISPDGNTVLMSFQDNTQKTGATRLYSISNTGTASILANLNTQTAAPQSWSSDISNTRTAFSYPTWNTGSGVPGPAGVSVANTISGNLIGTAASLNPPQNFGRNTKISDDGNVYVTNSDAGVYVYRQNQAGTSYSQESFFNTSTFVFETTINGNGTRILSTNGSNNIARWENTGNGWANLGNTISSLQAPAFFQIDSSGDNIFAVTSSSIAILDWNLNVKKTTAFPSGFSNPGGASLSRDGNRYSILLSRTSPSEQRLFVYTSSDNFTTAQANILMPVTNISFIDSSQDGRSIIVARTTTSPNSSARIYRSST